MKAHLTCPHCDYKWTWGYWEWIFKAPFHWFCFHIWKDFRRTKCPNCKRISWIPRKK